jgi:hypothetical protein
MRPIHDKKEALVQMERVQPFSLLDVYDALSPELKKDYDVLKIGFNNSIDLYDHLSESLKNDKQVILMCLSNKANVRTYKQLKSEMKSDPDIIRTALKTDGSMLKYMSQEIKDNNEMVNLAVLTHGLALEHASDRLKRHWHTVSIALIQDISAIAFMDKEFLTRPEKVVSFRFADFLRISMFNVDSNDKLFKDIKTIKNNLLLNKDETYIKDILNQFTNHEDPHQSGWCSFVFQLDTDINDYQIDESVVNSELNFHFSYLLPHWPLNELKKLNKNVDKYDIDHQELKTTLHSLFEKEFVRRNIVKVNQKSTTKSNEILMKTQNRKRKLEF